MIARIKITLFVSMALLLPSLASSQPGSLSEFQEQATLFAEQCAKCHTLGEGDRVGPDLQGITDRRDREWLAGFIRKPSDYLDSDRTAQELLRQYADVRMPDLGISQIQAEGLLGYIEAFSKVVVGGAAEPVIVREPLRDRVRGPVDSGAFRTTGLFVLFGSILLAALGWRHGYQRSAQVMIVVALAAGYWSFGGAKDYHLLGNDQGYEPEQPIEFSHALHAGELDISCLYCHHAAQKGPVAGIPSPSTCMNCHRVVEKRTTQVTPSREIAKLVKAWQSAESGDPQPVEWVRVHNLPDFVSFNHQVHVENEIQCQECHGAVQEMDRVRQVGDLSMGWCIQCHRLKAEEASTHWHRSGASQDCATCHW